MSNVVVKEASIEDAFSVHLKVSEFSEAHDEIDLFKDRIAGTKYLILVAYMDGIPAGYMISYDRYNDGSFYCWMAGVDDNYRRCGLLRNMMDYQISWARNNGYNKIKIKTQNDRREMLSFLVKNGWNFISVKEKENILDYKISLELDI